MSILIMNEVWQNAPADKGDLLILLALADWADDKGRCFPAIATLAAKGRMSERNAQRCLTNLRERGIIRVDIGSGPKGCNVYHIDIAGMKKAALSEVVTGDKMSPPDADARGDISDVGGDVGVTGGVTFSTDRGDVGVTQTVIEPPVEPSTEPSLREGASEREISRSIEKGFWRTIKDWPDFAGMPKDRAKAAWFALTAEERDLAERRRDAWFALLKVQRKSHVPAPSTYFGEKLFLEVPDQPSECVKPQLQNPFSRPWMALWLGELAKPMATAWPVLTAFQQMQMRDPAKAGDVEMERRRKYGWPKAAAMAAEPKPMIVQPQYMAMSEGFQKVHRDSREAAEWKALFEHRGWPWLSTNFEWLYLPPGEPEVAMGEYMKLLNEGKGDDDAA